MTAPADCMILAGIARAHFLRACRTLGYTVSEQHFTLTDLMAAREIIVISSGTLCRPAAYIDGKQVGGRAPEMLKPLQDMLLGEYMRVTDGER